MKIKISKSQWEKMGKEAGWKVAQVPHPTQQQMTEDKTPDKEKFYTKDHKIHNKDRYMLRDLLMGPIGMDEATVFLKAILSTPEGKKRAELLGIY